MKDKKNSCKYDDHIENKPRLMQRSQTTSKLAADFKLDRIYPRNINIGLNLDQKENPSNYQHMYNGKISQHLKTMNIDHKMYHEYLSLKDQQVKKVYRKNKISQIFNIRSINLVEKQKPKEEKQEKLKIDRPRPNMNQRTKTQKGNKDLHLKIREKKQCSPDHCHLKIMTEKRSSSFQKIIENKSVLIQKNGDNFEHKLQEYFTCIKETCKLHGVTMKEIENYPKNGAICYIGKGNNGRLVRQTLKKRWWWTFHQEKKSSCNLIWTQLKQKSYYQKNLFKVFQHNLKSPSKGSRKSLSPNNRDSFNRESTGRQEEAVYLHNHFQNNEYLGNKKALLYNMKIYYQRQKKNVFDYLPVTFHVKQDGDKQWQEFTKYFEEDLLKNPGERRLWIVKPGQNSNRGNGITIHSQLSKIKELVSAESTENTKKRTFIIQKYIDRPFLYHKRKFDIRCYMLLVRLSDSLKGYWYQDGYIRTSCFEYHIEDTDNEFVHLTNDAIQVNSDKYGKYQDGNKLSYQNFQKYLDSAYKNCNYRFVEDICPQLKQIATESIEATCHLLKKCQGKLPTFQIFGLDFMIDENFKPWLIQINTNPCLEVSSATLERVIPNMLDNAFKLSVDLLFPPPLSWPNSKKYYLPKKVTSNLFELIFDESKRNSPLVNDQLMVDLGQIDEDSQIFQQLDEKRAICGDLMDSIVQNGELQGRN